MPSSTEFKLEIPLDASDIQDFKPDRAVKVVAYDRKGVAYESAVRLDEKGKGAATLVFPDKPGNVRVVVGPADASAEELKGLQTIGMDVPFRYWAGKNVLRPSPIVISAYYWWWWFRWCRTFKIHGRVVCPDNSPVPGATVCAYDVDWWWWWLSEDQVACATTDANGSFEISFRWCCGWWPWWWWARRFWRLEPALVDRIVPVLRSDPRLRRLPVPGPKPDVVIFHELLSERGSALQRSAVLRSLPGSGRTSRLAAFDPTVVDSLRGPLLQRLPAAAELERLHIWPWWPWRPWLDCAPDLIFRATQNCRGEDTVILSENVWDTRWDIPTDLNVTLVANDKACCGWECHDPKDCPEGNCILISNVCDDNVGNIGGNAGAPDTPAGYLNPGLVSRLGDRPYSGTIPIKGAFGDAAAVDYYAFEVSTVGCDGPWDPMPPAAAGGFTRSYFDPATQAWVPVTFNFASIGPHNVIESLEHWEANNGPRLWEVSTRNLLMAWVTPNNFADGTYYLRVKGWSRPGYAGPLVNERDLPLCGDQLNKCLVLTIDNQISNWPGPADFNGHRCGPGSVHNCTIEPDTEFLAVKIVHQDGTESDLRACGKLAIVDTDLLQIDFVAYDPDGHLGYYTLQATYDVDLSKDLLSMVAPGAGLIPSPIPPAWAPAASQVGPDYGTALGPQPLPAVPAVSPTWNGGAIRLTVNAKRVFEYTCCYQLQLFAHKRTVGAGTYGCDHGDWVHWNVSEYSFTIEV